MRVILYLVNDCSFFFLIESRTHCGCTIRMEEFYTSVQHSIANLLQSLQFRVTQILCNDDVHPRYREEVLHLTPIRPDELYHLQSCCIAE